MYLYCNFVSSSWQTPSKLILKVTNNYKFVVSSSSWPSPSKLSVNLPPNSKMETKKICPLIKLQIHFHLPIFEFNWKN
jgi:hypothetical protein